MVCLGDSQCVIKFALFKLSTRLCLCYFEARKRQILIVTIAYDLLKIFPILNSLEKREEIKIHSINND